jgi:hypothetical protein
MNAPIEALQNKSTEAAYPQRTAGPGLGHTNAPALHEPYLKGRTLNAGGNPPFRGAFRGRRGVLVLRRIAQVMVGRKVSVRGGEGGPVHGIVTNVLIEEGRPKVMVSGVGYTLADVLTVAPPELA